MGSGPKEIGEQSGYLSYLLRLWRAEAGREGARPGNATWRASLESALTGERQGFASLDELVEFLQRQTGSVADVEGKQG